MENNIDYYKSYKNVRDAVWQLIIDMNIRELPVKISRVIRNLGIELYTYQENKETLKLLGIDELIYLTDGLTLFANGKHKIFYDSSKSPERIRFTLAHELGHIICKHEFQLMNGSYITTRNTEPTGFESVIEHEANMFAARLLAPACVLHELKLFTAEEIAECCAISKKASEFRSLRLSLLEKRNEQFIKEKGYGCYYLSPLEKTVKEQFSDYINSRL